MRKPFRRVILSRHAHLAVLAIELEGKYAMNGELDIDIMLVFQMLATK